MDTEQIRDAASELGDSIDDLETALLPLFNKSLNASASRLPLLDKAKLYVLATYSIESLLFSTLRLNGVDAKEHPVFKELARVKEYFAKIKTAENPHEGRGRLDKDAAGRFIKHGLAGNEQYDQERGERQVKRKLEEIAIGKHTRFDDVAKRMKANEETVPIVRASDLDGSDNEEKRSRDLSVGEAAASRMRPDSKRTKDEKKHKRQSHKRSKLANGD